MNILDKIQFKDVIFEEMWKAKEVHLIKVCEAYKSEIKEFKEYLKGKLKESNMHTGACNLAVEFIIIEVEEGKLDSDYKKAIHENILTSSIYYANCQGISSVYGEV